MIHYRPEWLSPEKLREVLNRAGNMPADLDAAMDDAAMD